MALENDGTPEGTRTPDPLLRRQLLYPAELQAHITSCPRKSLTALPSTVPVSFHLQSRHPIAVSFADGAGDGNRTHATSLEGWDSTIELHPHDVVALTTYIIIYTRRGFVNRFSKFF